MLRHLVTAGVLRRDDTGYGLTPLGAHLRDDDESGVRAWLDLDGAVGRADLCQAHLLHTVRTGEPAYPLQFGRPFWEDLAADPDRSASFDALMGSQHAGSAAVATEYDWGRFGSVTDVGGGNGTLLSAILRAHPGLRGTVVDLPSVAAAARHAFAEAGLADRADAVPGSFFDQLPTGADAYLLSSVLHDWDDEHAVAILRRCAAAAVPDGPVLVVDSVGEGTPAPSTEMDLRMMAYFSGRERDLPALATLARSAGLAVQAVTPLSYRAVVELRPA